MLNGEVVLEGRGSWDTWEGLLSNGDGIGNVGEGWFLEEFKVI